MQERQHREVRPRESSGAGAPDGDSIFDGQPLGFATVAHGLYHENVPIREASVAELRQRLSDDLDIHPESMPVLDGQPADETTVVRAGQRLTFVRRAGEKGVWLA